MFYLIMSFLSENPAHGPETLGLILDLFFVFFIIYLVKEHRNEKEN